MGEKQSVVYAVYRYFATLATGKVILWSYLIWYLVTVAYYFDPSPAIWLNAMGISVVIGFALLLSVSHTGIRNIDRWQVFRLFMMPFCVSSFSSLIKGHGYILIIPPRQEEVLVSVGLCAVFIFSVVMLKLFSTREAGGVA